MFRRLLPRRSLQGALLGCSALFLPVCIFFIISRHQATPPLHLLEHPYFHYDLDIEEKPNEDQNCILPKIHPFHPSIWSYLTPPKAIVCKYRRPELTFVDYEGFLKFNASEVEASGYTIGKSLHCFWNPVRRGGTNGQSDDTVTHGAEVELKKDGIALPTDVEVVRVRCRNFAGISVYDMLHPHVLNVKPEPPITPLKHPINVLIFGLDSMSRLSFIRLLPKTYRYLTEELKMVLFRGMNKVGDNTYPNLVAMLTGHKAYGGGLPDESEGFDEWPLIWRNYSKAGYSTLWAEDFPQYGLFNYLAKGFRRKPTLHYLRPFWLAVESSSLLKLSSHMCYGSTPKHLLQMDYVRRSIQLSETRNQTYFAFSFLAEISHEYLSRVTSADGELETFFRFLKERGYLENTLLVVMSDHGHRFDAIRRTEVGFVEERMPFFALRLPSSLTSDTIKENLRVNGGRLVTPFDVHATLVDILNYAATGHALGSTKEDLGISLFGPIPANRTCNDASIPTHYCVCETEIEISNTDPVAVSAAEHLVAHINTLLSNEEADIDNRCASLRLGEIKASRIVQTQEDAKTSNLQKIRVLVEVEPSKGLFEATLSMGDKKEVMGDVSRINIYAEQSKCIKHSIFRKYCFCKDHNVTKSTR